MIRIAITGPESTGKTTISRALAEHFQTFFFEEYARKYLTDRNGVYNFEDLPKIAVLQEEERKAVSRSSIIIYDTENIVLEIWAKVKYGKTDPFISKLVEEQRFDHYFLCSPEGTEWEEDPLRENPNDRDKLFSLYESRLKEKKLPYSVLKGEIHSRIDDAIELIEDMQLSQGGYCV